MYFFHSHIIGGAIKALLSLCLWGLWPGSLNAQEMKRFNSFSYNVNEGLLQSTISDIAFDNNNFCWVAFPNGIQRFDGKNFITIPVQPGLPDDKLARFFRMGDGSLLISHTIGISKYDIGSNSFKMLYTHAAPQKTPAQFIGEDKSIIYFYAENGSITGIDGKSFKKHSETVTGFPNHGDNINYRPKISQNIIDHKVAFTINSVIHLWDLEQQKLLHSSAPQPGISIFFLRLRSATEVLYYNNIQPDALQCYNFSTGNKMPLVVKGKDNKPIGRCQVFNWREKWLISFNNRLYETDSSLQLLKSEIVNFQNQPVTGLQSISGIWQDNFGNLYLQTISGGIKKLIRNNYPFRYYSTSKTDSNFVVSIFPDKRQNRILAGTSGNGLLVFDTLQRLVHHIKTLPGRKSAVSIPNIAATNQGDYLLFVQGERHIWKLSKDLSTLKSLPLSTSLPWEQSGFNYFAKSLLKNDRELLTQSEDKLYRTNLASMHTTEHFIAPGYIMSGIITGPYFLTHVNDELIYLDTASLKEVKRIPFKNTGNVRCFATRPGDRVSRVVYVGSNKGIFKIDSSGRILQQFNKGNGLPDECIYAMAFDELGMLWCSTNKGLLKISKENKIQHFKKEDGLQENEFNTNTVAASPDGELFFGGVNGISSFYPEAINTYYEEIKLFFTRVRINNEDAVSTSAPWNLSTINLPAHQNSLSFDFVAMGNNNPGQYIYQYKMEGVDDQWIQNEEMQTVRYYLQPGTYVFKVYAGTFFNKDAPAMKEIKIIIRAPFYKTWWFLAVIAALVLGLLAYIINQYNRNKYRKKLEELNAAHRLQAERERISRDLHDNIGAYANAVLYSTELLEKEKELVTRRNIMQDLKFASKDIITSLRETIWALKKDSFTVNDCVMRIRNFVQPLSRHYPHIQFLVEGEGSYEYSLHYTKALNVVRIIQEAVTNAIKHSNATKIAISCSQYEKQWQMQVIDNGIGFSENNLRNSDRGYGLSNMKERAAEAGFNLQVITAKGAGTRLIITI